MPRTKGVALVIVLSMLALMTVLVIAFFSSVTTDFSSAKAYSRGEGAKQLADSAVNIVMAQIKDATVGFDRDASGNVDTSKRLAWASQPGMVRTWDDGGTPVKNYKLYSSDKMVVTGNSYDPADDLADMQNVNGSGGKWNTQPAIYTDLNSPVLIRDDVNGTVVLDAARATEKYTLSAPIIDPNNLEDATKLSPAGPANTLTYDANKDKKPDIEGFFVGKPDTFDSGKKISPSNNPVPMPVKWVYVLEDGQLTTPALSGGKVKFNVPGQPVPSAKNPIVGRVAFWADDETSKINVNTASEGTFWDVPVCASLDEMPLAANPPTKGEFQRVPGHPAMTCLSPVLGSGTLEIKRGVLQTSSDIAKFTQNLKKIYDFTPRISAGDADASQGSQGGTAPISQWNYPYAPQVGDLKNNPTGVGAQNIVIPKEIVSDTDRLFPTVDDILFKPDRTPQDDSIISGTALKQARFFLTANSRAPEVTLFNTPRISLWPITWPYKTVFLSNNYAKTGRIPVGLGDPTRPLSDLLAVNMKNGTVGKYMAPQEQLLAFCAQIGKDSNNLPLRYFFQRQNPDSPTYDWDNIKRNRDLLGTYLGALTGKNVPGFGGSFTSKYGVAGRDSILVNAFDMIRALNMVTTGTDSTGKNSTLYDFTGMYFPVAASGTSSARDQPMWQITPLKIDLGSGPTKSIGQFPTIPEVALIFYATKRNDPYPVTVATSNSNGVVTTSTTSGPFNPNFLITSTNPQTTEMRMVVYLSEFTVGNPYIGSSYWVKATGPSFKVNGSSINFPASTGNLVQMKETQWFQGIGLVSRFFESPANRQYSPFTPKSFVVKGPGVDTPNAYKRWEFVSNPIPLNSQNGTTTFNFSGSKVTFEIYAPNPSNQDDSSSVGPGTLVQSIEIDFSKLDQAAAIPLAPRWIENQIIPDAAASKVSNDNLVLTSGSVPGSNPAKWYAKSPHREVAKKGFYLYQDEGIDSKLSFRTVNKVAVPEPPALTLKYVSPSWALRMACATADTNYSSNNCYYNITSPDMPELPLLTAGGMPHPQYPVYYPANRQNTNADGGVAQSLWYYGATAIISPYDTVLSMALDPKGPAKGDARVLAARASVPATYFAPVGLGVPSMPYDHNSAVTYPRTTEGWQRHSLGISGYTDIYNQTNNWGSGMDTTNASDKISLLDAPMGTVGWGLTGNGGDHRFPGYMGQQGEVNVAVFGRTVSMNGAGVLGDWTNSSGNFQDGCTVWYPDQWYATLGWANGVGYGANLGRYEASVPFFGRGEDVSQTASFFSPNRQVSSGVALFGTLLTPDASGIPQPWQTLLFCPNPAIGSSHPGFGVLGSKVPDHVLLDLFWMPVVEPYAISEPLSTAGKINLNYQIVPFTNIERKTGLCAVMKSTKITAIPSSDPNILAKYKSAYYMRTDGALSAVSTRLNINIDETLSAFDKKFEDDKDLFRSASQICEMFLVPEGQTLGNVKGGGFWGGQRLTGDNSREAPYGHIYPRVTTKSNTFQVHYKVQLLKKRTRSVQTEWEEGKDQVVSEYRGSTILERYIDPNDSSLPDFATKSLMDKDAVIDKYYRFRVVSTKAFMP